MNLQTAEILLRCYRPAKKMDGRIRKAVDFAESDEHLRRVLSDQMDFDEQIIETLRCIAAPEDLRQRLSQLSARPEWAGRSLRRHAGHPAIVSAIAGILLIVGLFVYSELEGGKDFPGREEAGRMVGLIEKMSGVELEPVTGAAGSQGDWFYLHGFEGFNLPREVAPLPAIGARTFKMEGHSVCQLAIDRHDSILNLFRASDFGMRITPEGQWRFFEDEDWAAAVRQDGDRCVMLAFRGTQAEMEEWIATLRP